MLERASDYPDDPQTPKIHAVPTMIDRDEPRSTDRCNPQGVSHGKR